MLVGWWCSPLLSRTVCRRGKCERASSTGSTSNRKVLIPLIKFLHPDLLPLASEEVREVNLACIQNINDLWDTLKANVEAAAGRPAAFGLDVKVAFRAKYDLSCYLRAGVPQKPVSDKKIKVDKKDDSVELVKHTFTIEVSDALCKRQSVSQTVFASGIDKVLAQQGRLFELAGLENPWAEQSAKMQDDAESFGSQAEDPGRSRITAETDLFVFEHWLTKNAVYQELKLDRHGRSYISRAFNTPEMQDKLIKKGPYLSDRQRLWLRSENDVDLYIQRNHVQFMPMSATLEFEALRELRKFLLDFADAIYFDIEGWCRVLMILHCDEVTDKFVTNRVRREQAGKPQPPKSTRRKTVFGRDEEEESSSDEESTGRRRRKAPTWVLPKTVHLKDTFQPGGVLYRNGPYSVEGHDGKFVLRIPHNFKRRDLLEFMGDALPCSRAPFYQPYLNLTGMPKC